MVDITALRKHTAYGWILKDLFYLKDGTIVSGQCSRVKTGIVGVGLDLHLNIASVLVVLTIDKPSLL